MIGAIIGDVCGSFREFARDKKKHLGLLPQQDVISKEFGGKKVGLTDDSILTLATSSVFLDKNWTDVQTHDFKTAYSIYATMYRHPIGSYGSAFKRWIDNPVRPYNSCGNGSAMRVSPVVYATMVDENATIDDVLYMAYKSASVTHNHPEGIRGAQWVAMAIYYAKNGYTMDQIIKMAQTLHIGYQPIKMLDHFDSICQETIPLAMNILMNTTSFNEAVLEAVTLPNADSDTLGAIVGSVAEALYGIPLDTIDMVKPYVDQDEFLSSIFYEFKRIYY